MIAKQSLEKVLGELLQDSEVKQFPSDWILRSPGATEESVRDVYRMLKGYGLKDKIIALQAQLLGMNPKTIERNYNRLSALGLKDKKIATQVQLLGIPPETIERNYQNHVGLLRQDYKDRASGRDLLATYAQLLGIPSETIESNVQYLYGAGIDYCNGILLGTTPQLKRRKMAWMLRELFDYRVLQQDERRGAIDNLYGFIRENPRVLIKSISIMERDTGKLRELLNNIIDDTPDNH